MIQIVKQRVFPGKDAAVFVYTEPVILLPSLTAVFTKFNDVLANLPEDERHNLFYTLAHHTGTSGASKPQRTNSTFESQSALAFDIDADPKKPEDKPDLSRIMEYVECVGKVIDAPPAAFTVVNSGNGIHVIFGLRHPIRSNKFFDENRPAYNELRKKLHDEFKARGLLGYADHKIFDGARVLRLPGSLNIKPDRENKQCQLVQYSQAVLDIDLQKLSGLDKLAKDNVSPAEIRRNYPTPDFQEMVKECHFVKWAVAKPSEVHEPQAFDLFSLLAPQLQDSKTTLSTGVEVTPKQLAKKIFDGATASASIKQADFEEKWDQAKNYGGRKCETIHNSWIGGCEKCPHWQKIPTPLALKGPDHIGSKSNGYWVMNSKGHYQHPHYEDLSKVYSAEAPFIVTEESRVMLHTGSHFEPAPDFKVKSWLEEKMKPTDPLRESHRTEFLNKVKSRGAISNLAKPEFFTETIRGKLNCQNGVVDILTGQIVPHSPKFGFLYTLPHVIDPHAEGSEFFLDWLSTIMQERVELMDALLDVMAYTLWPSYDDHVFTFLVGEGSNGKSTVIRIIEAMVGVDNFSSVGIQQLGQNRFAPSQLEGKLVNLSEESSGGGQEMDIESMNVVKNLSAGGTMLAERKGQDGFMFSNQAKLIFSANHTPKFKEAGVALKRRMLVIPFDHKIENMDSRVGDRLVKEVPLITSMLLKRIQENTARNGGRFLVYRGGQVAQAAQEKVAYGGTNILEWANECLESKMDFGKDSYVEVDATYQHYKAWCDTNGFRYPTSKLQFGKVMRAMVISKAASEVSSVKRIANRTIRVYPYTKYKEGIQHAPE